MGSMEGDGLMKSGEIKEKYSGCNSRSRWRVFGGIGIGVERENEG